MERKIVWNRDAVKYLALQLKEISKESIKNAELIENAILSRLETAIDYPEKYPKDKYKKSNQGNFRAFETHSFRVSYRFTNTQIRILRIRHVKQKPKEY